MTIEEKKLLFLQDYCQGVVQNKTKSWADYAEKYKEHKDRVRKWWRSFVAIHQPKGNWFEGELITPDWTSTINQALSQGVATRRPTFKENGDMEVPLPYDGLKPRKVWEGQVKGGGTRLLHSYEFDQEKERFEAFEEKLIGRIKSIVAQEPVIHTPKVESNNKLLLNIYTADKHVGADTRNAMFGNKYDYKEYCDRMKVMLHKVFQLADIYGTFDKVNFVDLGDGVDGVDGQTARKGHTLDQNLETCDQYDHFVASHKYLMDNLIDSQIASEYQFTAATNDNHNGFFMYITARAVEEYLNAKYPDVKTLVSRQFMFHEEYGVHRLVYLHGKDHKYMKYGFPFRLNPKVDDFISEYIDYHQLANHISYDKAKSCVHVLKGDLHQTGEEFGKKYRYKNIMSVYGSSSYIQHNYGKGYKGFEFEIFNKEEPSFISGKHFYND